jgi:putative transposase
MARLARVVVPGQPHHVTHRGNRRADVFVDDEDRLLYKNCVEECARKAKLEIWAYCLMSNHVHLLVVPQREDSLAKGVGLAHRRYAVALNKRHGWDGHLWANRYFSTPLDDAHLWAAVRYVERNPVRAAMVETASEYPWSSALAHTTGQADTLLWPERPFPGPVKGWSDFLRDDDDPEQLARIRRCTKTGRPCGGDGFIDWLEDRLKRILRPQPAGRKKTSASETNQPDMLEPHK